MNRALLGPTAIALLALLPIATAAQQDFERADTKDETAWQIATNRTTTATIITIRIRCPEGKTLMHNLPQEFILVGDERHIAALPDLIARSFNSMLSQPKFVEQIAAGVLQCRANDVKRVSSAFWKSTDWIITSKKAVTDERRQEQTTDATIFTSAEVRQVSNFDGRAQAYFQVFVSIGPASGTPISKDKADSIARKITEELVNGETKRLSQYVLEHTMYEENVANLKKTVQQEQKVIAELRQKTSDESDLLSQDQLLDITRDANRQLLDARLSATLNETRKGAIEKQIAELTRKVQQKSADSEMLRNLSRIVELRKSRFDRLKKIRDTANGQVTEQELEAAEEQMLTAIVELDRTKSNYEKSEGAERINALEIDLSNLGIDREEGKARIEFLEAARAKARDELIDRRKFDANLDANRKQLSRTLFQHQRTDDRLKESEGAMNLIGSLQFSIEASVSDK